MQPIQYAPIEDRLASCLWWSSVYVYRGLFVGLGERWWFGVEGCWCGAVCHPTDQMCDPTDQMCVGVAPLLSKKSLALALLLKKKYKYNPLL